MTTIQLKKEALIKAECSNDMTNIKDAIGILEGRWKPPVLLALSAGNKRFKQISKEINGISDKMLSKELGNFWRRTC